MTKAIEITDDTECCVCYNDTNNVLIPCRHSVCVVCMEKWYKHNKKACCPYCRTALCSFTDQITFDYDCMLFANMHQHFGITVSYCENGALVKYCSEKDVAYTCGLRKGTVITHVNGIKVESHNSLITIMEACKKNNASVYLKIFNKKKSRLGYMLRFYRNLSFKPRRI